MINPNLCGFSRNHWAYESEILCGASMLRGNKILCAKSGSNAQHVRYAHKCSKISWADFHETWYVLYLGLQPIVVCSNDDPRMNSTNFTAMSVLET